MDSRSKMAFSERKHSCDAHCWTVPQLISEGWHLHSVPYNLRSSKEKSGNWSVARGLGKEGNCSVSPSTTNMTAGKPRTPLCEIMPPKLAMEYHWPFGAGVPNPVKSLRPGELMKKKQAPQLWKLQGKKPSFGPSAVCGGCWETRPVRFLLTEQADGCCQLQMSASDSIGWQDPYACKALVKHSEILCCL